MIPDEQVYLMKHVEVNVVLNGKTVDVLKLLKLISCCNCLTVTNQNDDYVNHNLCLVLCISYCTVFVCFFLWAIFSCCSKTLTPMHLRLAPNFES